MQSIIVTNSRGDIQYQPFVMLTRAVGAKAGIFAEYGGFFQQNAHTPPQEIAHFGGVYKVNRHNQVDLQFGFGMSKSSPTAFVGMGYSYRFDGLPWGNEKKQNSPPVTPSNSPGSSGSPSSNSSGSPPASSSQPSGSQVPPSSHSPGTQ
jgi:hypothetical protein